MSYEYNRIWNIRGSGFDDIEWGLILSESSKSIENFKGKLKGPFGEGAPTLNAYEISFSGEPSHESFIFSRYGNFSSCDTNGFPYDDVVVSILSICKKVAGDKIEIPWFLDNTPLFRKLAAWDTLPKGWTEESVKKFWESMTKRSPKHPVTRCMKQMEGKVTNTGAFCGSLADKADPGWRSRKASIWSGKMTISQLQIGDWFRFLLDSKNQKYKLEKKIHRDDAEDYVFITSDEQGRKKQHYVGYSEKFKILKG